MPGLHLTRAKHLVPFASFLRESGESVDRLLLRARLPGDCLDDAQSLVPSMAAFRFRELAARVTGLDDLALRATEKLKVAQLGSFGQLLLRSLTLAQALNEFCRLTSTETSLLTVQCRYERDGLWFSHHFKRQSDFGEWHSDLYILQWMLKVVRLTAPGWSPDHIRSQSEETVQRAAILAAIGCERATFGCQWSGFKVPESILALGVRHRVSLGGRTRRIEREQQASAPAETFSESLHQVIFAYRHDRWLSIDQAAEVCQTSTRTLQRRLADEGTSFSSVLTDSRLEVGASLLEHTDKPVCDIALELGYTTHGNFSRAFRQWTGVAPAVFRQQRKKS